MSELSVLTWAWLPHLWLNKVCVVKLWDNSSILFLELLTHFAINIAVSSWMARLRLKLDCSVITINGIRANIRRSLPIVVKSKPWRWLGLSKIVAWLVSSRSLLSQKNVGSIWRVNYLILTTLRHLGSWQLRRVIQTHLSPLSFWEVHISWSI